MHRHRPGFLIIFMLVIVSSVRAGAQLPLLTQCSSAHCAYIPAVFRDAATPATAWCTMNPPAPGDVPQVWLTNEFPLKRSVDTVCVRFVAFNQALVLGIDRVVVHYPTGDVVFGPVRADGSGMAALTFSIAADAPHELVAVDVVADLIAPLVGVPIQRTERVYFTPR